MLHAALVSCLVLAALEFLAPDTYPAELAAFFRPWIAAGVIAIGVCVLLRPRDPGRIVAVGVIGVALWGTLVPLSAIPAPDASASLRVMTLNTLHSAVSPARIAERVAEGGVEILLLQEARPPYSQRVAEALGWEVWTLRGHRSAVLVAPDRLAAPSACPDAPTGEAERLGRHTLRVPLCLHEGTGVVSAVLYSVHPESPRISKQHFRDRNAALAELAETIEAEAPHRLLVVGGDFNAPVWSQGLRAFLARTGLAPTGGADQIVPTRFMREFGWPTWFGAPIDHVLVGGSGRPGTRMVGDYIGSDHLPVVGTVALPEPLEPVSALSDGR